MNYLFITIDRLENRSRLLNHIKTAREMGHAVTVLAFGNYRPGQFDFNVVGINALAGKGPFKFIPFNIKLACYLLFHRFDCLYIRGVWVVPGVFAASLFKEYAYMYDAHEYFAGLNLVQQRIIRRWIWLTFEKWIVSKSRSVLTVSQPIAEQYLRRYQILKRITVIRNLPRYQQPNAQIPDYLRLDKLQKAVLFFGYLMEGRGLTNLVHAVSEIADIPLLLVGEGEIKEKLRALAVALNCTARVHFKPFVPNHNLISFISQARIGVSLLEPISDNHRYALPNKLFECMMAGLPVLASDIITHRYYIDTYDIGVVVDACSPDAIKAGIQTMLQDQQRWQQWHDNCLTAARELNWQQEAVKLKAELRKMDQQATDHVG